MILGNIVIRPYPETMGMWTAPAHLIGCDVMNRPPESA